MVWSDTASLPDPRLPISVTGRCTHLTRPADNPRKFLCPWSSHPLCLGVHILRLYVLRCLTISYQGMHLILNISLLCFKSLQLLFLEAILSLLSLSMAPFAPTNDDAPSAPSSNLNVPLLRKRHSWPPLHKKPRTSYFEQAIDDDPFSYFVSDPSENNDVYLNGMRAGIDDTPRSRSYSPRHRATLMSAVVHSSPTNRLKKWIEKMELRCFHRSPRKSPPVIQRPMPSPEPFAPSKIPLTSSPPVRGRRDIRVGSAHRVAANGRSKQRRPRAWRAPSAEIWPVIEEKEGESIGLGILVP